MESEPPDHEPAEHPIPLPYRNPRDDRPRGPGRGREFAAGFFAYVGTLFITFSMLRILSEFGGGGGALILLLPLAGLMVLSMYFNVKRGWRGFLPGVLTGLGLSCLIGIPLCFYVVQNI